MEKDSYMPKPDYSNSSTATGGPATNTSKAGGWDLFLGRLIGSCIVGCWLIGAILLIGSGIVLYYVMSGVWSMN